MLSVMKAQKADRVCEKCLCQLPYLRNGFGCRCCSYHRRTVQRRNQGACIGHVSPEAADGGTIALVRDGDIISIDMNKCSLNLKVSDDELENRRKNWVCPPPKIKTGYLARYSKFVTSASEGAVMKV